MSSTVSVTATSPSAAPTAGSCHNVYDIPTQDAACAMPYGSNHTDIMSRCCDSANVISYYDDCGLYCLAIGQDVGNLTQCLFDNGAADTDVWCRGNQTQTATETGDGGAAPSTASARVVATGGAGSSDDDDGNGSGGNGNGNSNNDSSDDDDDDDSPAAAVMPGLSVMGFTVGALLFSAAFGALQM